MFKKILFTFLLTQSLSNQIYGNSELQDIKKIIAIQQAEIKQLKGETQQLGSIQASILDESNFQKLNGRGWVLMDGRNIGSSQLAKLTGQRQIPDVRGKFLRAFGPNAAPIGQTQNDSTAVNGLKNSASNVTGTVSLNHDHGTITSSAGSRTKVDVIVATSGGASGTYDVNWENHLPNRGHGVHPGSHAGTYAWPGRNHTHSVKVPPLSKATNLIGGKASAQEVSGDLETRPVNISVNYFIKID